ncbi:unnamed protein product [Sphagnum troendelagicum]|uniref:RNA-binding S4 domain-containing protein n=1 Tax=Sphagnum troendelagicum TaxID=128251 RepID=A0ABP0TG36_9BRYO
MQADGRRLQQNLRLRQQPRLESLRLHAQSQAKRRKKTKLRANVKGWALQKKTNKKQSDFSKQLQTIQKLSLFYDKLPIKKMQKSKTQTYLDKKNSLLFDIEKRLDVILVRLNFCSTTFQARQLISHKKIYVNYKMVNIPGFQVSNGDLISIQGNSLYCIK